MFKRTFLIAVVAVLVACTAAPPTVIQELDESTAATITHSKTPMNLSPMTVFERDNIRPYVDIGTIQVNRNRIRKYFLWFGIWDVDYGANRDQQPEEFESVIIIADGEELLLDVQGWTHQAIGSSKPIYKKLFPDVVDAYYQVTLAQIRLLAEAGDIQLRTTGAAPREFAPWYREERAKSDLAEFLRRVSE